MQYLTQKLYFTSDTHFDSERTLSLSIRPFKSIDEMNNTILDNINDICNGGILYHLGDFGNHEFAEKIKVPICLIMGNYEIEEMNSKFHGIFSAYRTHLMKEYGYIDVRYDITMHDDNHDKSKADKLICIHKPSDCLIDRNFYEGERMRAISVDERFYLFGHTHGLQKVKRFGMDVGVDAHHFKPIALDTIWFYKNAIKNHYDTDVWC